MNTSAVTDAPDGKTQVIWVVCLILVAPVVRMWHFSYVAPWRDEMHSPVYAGNEAGHLIDFRRTTDIHPPLYFLSLKGWLEVCGETRDAARAFSAVVGTARDSGCLAQAEQALAGSI